MNSSVPLHTECDFVALGYENVKHDFMNGSVKIDSGERVLFSCLDGLASGDDADPMNRTCDDGLLTPEIPVKCVSETGAK